MLTGDPGKVLHLRAPRDQTVLEVLRQMVEPTELGCAAFDAQLQCLWATPAAHRRFVALTERAADEAASTLFTSAGAFPRWHQGAWRLAGREVATARLGLERGRESIVATMLPVVDPDDATVALLMVFDDGTEEALPEDIDPMWWWQRAVDAELTMVASRASGAVIAESPKATERLGRLRGPLVRLVRSPNRDDVETAHRRFVGGAATAGSAAVTLATEAGGLERTRLLWMTLAAGVVPLARLELLQPLRTVGGLSEGAAFGFEQAFLMVQASPDPLLLLDGTWIVAASPACEAVLGLTAESLIGQSVEVLSRGGSSRLEELRDQLVRGLDRATRWLMTVSTPGRAARTIELHLAPLAGERGRRAVAVARRVEQRDDRQQEAGRLGAMLAVAEVASDGPARLRGCLELLREEVGASSVELLRVDAASRSPGESYREPSGASPIDDARLGEWDRLLATTSGPLEVPDEGGHRGCWLIAALTMLGTGELWMVGARFDRGAPREALDRLRRAAQALGWVVARVERDRQVEALLRERELLLGVLDTAGTPAVATDADSHVELASGMFCELLGTTAEDVRGMALPELFDDGIASRLFGPLQVLLTQGGSWEGEISGRSRWGAPLVVRLNLEAHVGPDGRPIGLVACVATGQPRSG